MSLRIRQVKPDWWLDKDLHTRLSADLREFYIGLWMYADDAGVFEWNVARIGAELYPYRTPVKREAKIEEWAVVLETLDTADPHLVILTCGHAQVPKMPGHQRLAAETKQVRTVWKRHQSCPPARSRRSPQLSTLERNGTERNGNAQAPAPDGGAAPASDFDGQMAAHGFPRPAKVAS